MRSLPIFNFMSFLICDAVSQDEGGKGTERAEVLEPRDKEMRSKDCVQSQRAAVLEQAVIIRGWFGLGGKSSA